jgi:hypothetical protein
MFRRGWAYVTSSYTDRGTEGIEKRATKREDAAESKSSSILDGGVSYLYNLLYIALHV